MPWSVRIGLAAVLVAVVAAAIVGAALVFWLVLILLPVIVVACLVAWGAFRFQLWRARRDGQRMPIRW